MSKEEAKKVAPKAPRKGLPKKKKKRMATWKIVLIVLAVLIVAGVVTGFSVYAANRQDISDFTYQQKEKTQIFSSDNQVIAEMAAENRTYVSLDQIPKDLQNGLIATEDSRFYSHHGVDYYGIMRSLVSNLFSGNSTGQGASTITQQLARVLFDLDVAEPGFMDSVNRKMKEISISRQLEEKYTKDQILEMYLNEYYFGSASYGVQAAAQTYFGKNVSDLNLAESAMLAGLPQAPSAYAPNANFEAAKNRQAQVLARMVKEGYITQEQADQAAATEITIMPWSEEQTNDDIKDGYGAFINAALQEYAEALAPSVMKQNGVDEEEAVKQIRENIANGGYRVYTTINTGYQDAAISAMENGLDNAGFSQENGDTGAIVTVDKDGAVLGYYAGNTDIDMADSPRQPGSNIKPLYYSGAIEKGVFSPSSIIKDEPINIGGYSPKNYGGGYSGNVTITQALVNSLNIPAVKVFNTFGIENAIDWMKTLGITTFVNPGDLDTGADDYNLATALGGMTNGIKPIEMAAAFNCFNDGGVYNEPYKIVKVEQTNGKQVFDKSQLGLTSRKVMSEDTASSMWGILQQVVTSGTGGRAAQAYPTAGKTGTTDNEEDLWFTGMTGNITTSVWVGNLEHDPVGTGSYIPAGIYGSYVRSLINNDLVTEFAAPSESTQTTPITTPTPAATPTPTPEATAAPTPEPTVEPEPTPRPTSTPTPTTPDDDEKPSTEEE